MDFWASWQNCDLRYYDDVTRMMIYAWSHVGIWHQGIMLSIGLGGVLLQTRHQWAAFAGLVGLIHSVNGLLNG